MTWFQPCRLLAFFALGLSSYGSLAAQDPAPMVNPSIDDQGGPFSFFSQSVDEIGVMDAPLATEITPEASLYTGYGELVFLVGPTMQAIAPRLRTLEKGYLPIVHTSVTHEGIAYRFTFFTSQLSDGTLVNFARVVEQNVSATPARAVLTAGTRYQADTENETGVGAHRFPRPAEATHAGEYRQLGTPFHPDWVYGFSAQAFLRDGKVFYLFPDPPEQKLITPKRFYNIQPDTSTRKLPLLPTSLVGLTSYNKVLAPGEQRTITIRMPVIPVEEGPTTRAIVAADYDVEFARVISGWEKILAAGMRIDLPEDKVSNTFRASLIYDLIARDHIGSDYIQTVNKLNYHAFWLRDASDIAHMYDVTGYPLYASQVLAFFPRFQHPDGLFLSHPGQFDAQGEVLWEYADHYRMTHDRAFAESVFPSVERAVDWLQSVKKTDPLHLIPPSDVKDNEYVDGHVTGYNLLALDGLQGAALLAQAVGQPAKTHEYLTDYASYRQDLLKAIERCSPRSGGAIPPSLDGTCAGNDWGNLLGTYPGHVFAPNDPLISATLQSVRSRYQEGLTTYGVGRYLHHYLMIKNVLTEIARNEQQQPVEDLYALLVHTSSTQEGFEFAIRVWSDRDFTDNLPPHGWFAAEYRTMLRAMMVRDDEQTVHLLSVMSPAWMGAGKTIQVANAPTVFGTVGFTLTQPNEATAHLALESRWRERPHALKLHLPWFAEVSQVLVDGKVVKANDGMVQLPVDAREVTLHWTKKTGAPDLSYSAAVEAYRNAYRAHYQAYMQGQ